MFKELLGAFTLYQTRKREGSITAGAGAKTLLDYIRPERERGL